MYGLAVRGRAAVRIGMIGGPGATLVDDFNDFRQYRDFATP